MAHGVPARLTLERPSAYLARFASHSLEVFQRAAQASDRGGPARRLVHDDDDAVQPRVAGGGLEARRHAGEEAGERRLGLGADDRVVRPVMPASVM